VHFTAEEPSSSRSVLRTLLASGWLLVRGRKVRFEVDLNGETVSKEATSLKELDELIGNGKTPATFLRVLGGIRPASLSPAAE